jgi:flagellar protein FlaG
MRAVAGDSVTLPGMALEVERRGVTPPAGRANRAGGVAAVSREPANKPVRQSIQGVADALERYFEAREIDLHIRVHEGTGRVMVQVLTKSEGKVIREIPPEELLNLAARIDELVGLLFNANA